MRFGDDDLVPCSAGEDPCVDELAHRPQARPAREDHAFRGDDAVGSAHARDAPPTPAGGGGPEPEERRAFAEGHAGPLHRERVRANIPWWIDRAIGRAIAPAAVSLCGKRRIQAARLCCIDPPYVEASLALHGDAEGAVALVTLREREDQVAELAKPGVGTEHLLLRSIEVDREPAQRDGRRRSALRPNDTCRTARGPLTRQILLQDHDAAGPTRRGEPRCPAAHHAGADHHQVRRLVLPHRRFPLS